MTPKFNITFSFKEIFKEVKGKRIRLAVTLVDNAGYSCGIYNNYKEAKDAIPKIRKNMISDFKRRLKNNRSIPIEFLNS